MTETKTTQTEAYQRYQKAQEAFRAGRISLAELNAARRAYNRITQSENFDKTLAAGRTVLK